MNGNPVLVFKIPEPSSVKLLFNSLAHSGCMKSPVPSRPTPLIFAYFSRFVRLRSLEVAREKRECMCRSAIICILFQEISGVYIASHLPSEATYSCPAGASAAVGVQLRALDGRG